MAALPENDRIAGPFLATAGQTDFPADFPLIDAAAARVRVEAAGTGEVLVLADADVTIVAPTADAFTARVTARAAGDRVFVYSALPPARPRTHPANGVTRSETLEGDAVGAQAQLQEARRDITRAVAVPPGEAGLELPGVAARALGLPVFDADGAVALAPVVPGQTGIVTVAPSGAAIVMPWAAITGSGGESGSSFNGGLDGVGGSGQSFFGGVDG